MLQDHGSSSKSSLQDMTTSSNSILSSGTGDPHGSGADTLKALITPGGSKPGLSITNGFSHASLSLNVGFSALVSMKPGDSLSKCIWFILFQLLIKAQRE